MSIFLSNFSITILCVCVCMCVLVALPDCRYNMYMQNHTHDVISTRWKKNKKKIHQKMCLCVCVIFHNFGFHYSQIVSYLASRCCFNVGYLLTATWARLYAIYWCSAIEWQSFEKSELHANVCKGKIASISINCCLMIHCQIPDNALIIDVYCNGIMDFGVYESWFGCRTKTRSMVDFLWNDAEEEAKVMCLKLNELNMG